jgi:hypothetical protein
LLVRVGALSTSSSSSSTAPVPASSALNENGNVNGGASDGPESTAAAAAAGAGTAPAAEEAPLSEEEAALQKAVGTMPNGICYIGEWTQFDPKRRQYPATVRAGADYTVVISLKHLTLRRLAERYLMDDLSSSHANIMATMKMVS